MTLRFPQQVIRIVLLSGIAVACFIASFKAVGYEIQAVAASPGAPSLIATMLVPPLRMLAINETSPNNYSYVDTLYVVAANGSIYGCILNKSDPCTLGQLPTTLKSPDYSVPIVPISFMPSDSAIDFLAYRQMEAEGHTDIQLNMTADGKVWKEEGGANAYGTLFVVFPLDGIISLIITFLITWFANRLQKRFLRRTQPVADPLITSQD